MATKFHLPETSGDTTATGQKLGKDTSALPVLREAVRRSQFKLKRRQWKGTNKGIGLSLFFHGSGFTGGGEVKLASKASLELTATGARILVGSTEIGQGTRTMHAQIVADALGVPFDTIEVHDVDTAFVPDSGPTVASRTCMIVGKLLERSARDMRKRLGSLTPAQYFRQHGSFTVTSQYQPPPGLLWNDETYAGDAYGSYAWSCNVVEIEVDPVTYEVTPIHVTAVAEIGKAILSRTKLYRQGQGWVERFDVIAMPALARAAPVIPPIRPAQVFFGLIRGAIFGPPMARPAK